VIGGKKQIRSLRDRTVLYTMKSPLKNTWTFR